MKQARPILILLVGGLLTYLTYKSKYQAGWLDSMIWGALCVIGILIFLSTIIKEIQLFRSEKRLHNFGMTFLCVLFIPTIFILDRTIQNNFNKSTLLKVFYDGDYNGTAIDFKTDGTYIFDNSAIGMSSYFYGTYSIDGNKIVMDKDTIDNLKNFKYLKLSYKEIQGKSELYLFQTDSYGNSFERSDRYRVTIDNRNKE